MDRKKDIIKYINSISGRYSPYEVYSDWIQCSALSIENPLHLSHDSIWEERERLYLGTIAKYEKKEQVAFVEMSAMLVETLKNTMSDVLGRIFMESGIGSKSTGQFFTPYPVSLAAAKLVLTHLKPDEQGVYHVYEPSCGGGGMIIALAQVLKEKGWNYRRCMKVVAQDLDWKGVYMTYLQLSLLGIHAIVVQGNGLVEPYRKGYPESRIFRTPMARGVCLF